jgi:membrane-bound serine protease (ClpP class)
MKTLSRLFLILAFFCALGFFLQPAAVRADSPTVLVLKAGGEVAPAMKNYIARGIQAAADKHAELLVIELNTPGGLITTMTEIVSDIRASSVPVVVYVTPRGAMAASAGTLITLAGHAAAMAPETIIGAASPIDSQGQDLGTTAKTKEIEALKALVRSIASHRSPEAIKLAESTIESAKAVSADEAKSVGLVDFIATDLNDLLKQLDGYSVQLESGPRTLHTAGAVTEDLPMNFGEQILNVLIDTNIVFLLMTIGLLAIMFELSSPGGWVAGFIGVVALSLSVYGLGILPVNWFGIVFLALALVLFVLDIKAPTHGALTVAGIGSFAVGALVLFNSPNVPQFQRVSVPLVVIVSVLLGVSFAVILSFALRAQKVPLRMGQQTLIGAEGTAKEKIDPHGQVQLKSELWSADLAEGAEPIQIGDKVTVVAVEGLRIKVRKA